MDCLEIDIYCLLSCEIGSFSLLLYGPLLWVPLGEFLFLIFVVIRKLLSFEYFSLSFPLRPLQVRLKVTCKELLQLFASIFLVSSLMSEEEVEQIQDISSLTTKMNLSLCGYNYLSFLNCYYW